MGGVSFRIFHGKKWEKGFACPKNKLKHILKFKKRFKFKCIFKNKLKHILKFKKRLKKTYFEI
jgi:hypothetical protein